MHVLLMRAKISRIDTSARMTFDAGDAVCAKETARSYDTAEPRTVKYNLDLNRFGYFA